LVLEMARDNPTWGIAGSAVSWAGWGTPSLHRPCGRSSKISRSGVARKANEAVAAHALRVREFARDGGAGDTALWDGVAAMLADVAAALTQEVPVHGRRIWVEDDGRIS
jgi:hypothetical protein